MLRRIDNRNEKCIRNGGLIVENRKCESCVYFDKNTDNQTGMCREFECCVNKNQCCQWYVKTLDK